MISKPVAGAGRDLQALFQAGKIGDRTDGELLSSFLDGHSRHADEAFAMMVRRHGPMVLRVCMGVLKDEQDAQDAFQATFLTLARKADTIRVRESAASWLYGVARRVASRSRVSAARRRSHERRAGEDGQERALGTEMTVEEQSALDQEVGRLPEKYRTAILLCYYEGLSQEQAAMQLGWPAGTVRGRLSRARDLLRDRLARRGLDRQAMSVATGVGLLKSPYVPAKLIESTTTAAVLAKMSKGVGSLLSAKAIAGWFDGAVRPRLSVMVISIGLGLGSVLGVFAYSASRTSPDQGAARSVSLSGRAIKAVSLPFASLFKGSNGKRLPEPVRPTLESRYQAQPPVADGRIGESEYGTPVSIDWTTKNPYAAFQQKLIDPTQSRPIPGDPLTAPIVDDWTRSKTVDDLSLLMYTAYSDRSLFLAFHVRDQFVDAQGTGRPEQDDGVEIFIDGDRVPNDFQSGKDVVGSREGFQMLVNAAGGKLSTGDDFTVDDWVGVARKTADGYDIEIEIPLRLIDVRNGPDREPAGPGTLLHLGLALTDNDQETARQMSYAYLKTPGQLAAPWAGEEEAWTLGIRLKAKE